MTKDLEEIAGFIGATSPLKRRIELVVSRITELSGLEPLHVFVCEYQTDHDDGKKRVYPAIWLFGNEFVCECRNFTNELKFDYLGISRFIHWEMEVFKFDDLENPSENSRVNIRLSGSTSMYAELFGTGDNAKYLLELFNTFIKPKIA